jgi:NAD(P) transhydrogenase subunit beta
VSWENISTVLTTVLYMISSVLFIRGIKLLGKADTARRGNLMSSVGMMIAVVTVLLEKKVTDTLTAAPLKNAYLWAIAAIALGSVIGAVWAKKVEMTGMPQLVALFNGFGGLSSLLVALTQFMTDKEINAFSAIALGLTIAIGAIAFTGSIVAWGKLSGKAFKKNITIPAKNAVNVILAAGGLAGVALYALSIAGVLETNVGEIGIIIVPPHI